MFWAWLRSWILLLAVFHFAHLCRPNAFSASCQLSKRMRRPCSDEILRLVEMSELRWDIESCYHFPALPHPLTQRATCPPLTAAQVTNRLNYCLLVEKKLPPELTHLFCFQSYTQPKNMVIFKISPNNFQLLNQAKYWIQDIIAVNARVVAGVVQLDTVNIPRTEK